LPVLLFKKKKQWNLKKLQKERSFVGHLDARGLTLFYGGDFFIMGAKKWGQRPQTQRAKFDYGKRMEKTIFGQYPKFKGKTFLQGFLGKARFHLKRLKQGLDFFWFIFTWEEDCLWGERVSIRDTKRLKTLNGRIIFQQGPFNLITFGKFYSLNLDFAIRG